MAKVVKKKKVSIKAVKPVKKGQKKEIPEKLVACEQASKEIRLLEQGFQPEKNKIGSGFKGKNRVIIA